MYYELQRHEINSSKVLFSNKTNLKNLLELLALCFTPIKIFLNKFLSKNYLNFIFKQSSSFYKHRQWSMYVNFLARSNFVLWMKKTRN